MTSIGESLRRERLRRNLQLEQVSSELKISARMLAAIEAEDFSKLPGGVFTKSFVRQYAHLLGLDEEELASEVDRMLRPEEAAPVARPDVEAIPLPRMEAWQSVGDDRPWSPNWSKSLPALMLVVVVMLVCSAVYAFLQRQPKQTAANSQAPVAVHPLPPVASTSAAIPQPAPAQTPQAAEQSAGSAPASPAGATQEQEPPAAPLASAPAPQQATTAQSPTTPPGPVHVTITAIEPVWVRATSDGKYIFSGTIPANETRTIDGNEAVVLRLGNAGGVSISLNGKPVGDVGPKGQVRNVQLTSGGFQIVAAPKSPPPVDPL